MPSLPLLKLNTLTGSRVTPTNILRIIREDVHAFDGYIFIILGRPGPTGKSWLYNRLVDECLSVVEPNEHLCGLVKYTDDFNHIDVSQSKREITIVLNAPVEVTKKAHLEIEVEICPYWNNRTHKPSHTCSGCDCFENGNNIDNINLGIMIDGDRYCTIDSDIRSKLMTQYTSKIGEEK